LGVAYLHFEYNENIEENIAENIDYDVDNTKANLNDTKGNINNVGENYRENATFAFQMALAINEKSFSAITALAAIHIENDERTKAIELFRQALILKPNDVDMLTNYASLIGDGGDYVQAINYFNLALTHFPANFRALFGIGICYNAINKLEKAILYFDKALKIKPLNSELLFMKSDLLYKLENYDETIKVLNKLIEIEGENIFDNIVSINYFLLLGKCHFKQKNYDLAQTNFMKIVGVSMNCLVSALGAGEFDEMAMTKDVISECYYWLAKIHTIENNFEMAFFMLIKSFDLDITSKRKLEYSYEFPEILGEKQYAKFNKLLNKKIKLHQNQLENEKNNSEKENFSKEIFNKKNNLKKEKK
jgi:tetratricopeptide (TPR) repeat protein